MPLNADRFLEAARARLEPLRGTHIYEPIARDLLTKTEQVDAGYGRWLAALLPYLAAECGVAGKPRVLDFGCGSGELTVLMNTLGFETVGLDLHEEHLALARILAGENGVPESRFVPHRGGPLPFENGSFDLVTMFVVLEHLGDPVLDRVIPELLRVCSGGIFVQVPNRLQVRDDHTGLFFVPWMPRWLAAWYVRAHGPRRRYGISRDESWDVHYRTFGAIRRCFEKHGCSVRFVPDALVYPPLDEVPPLFHPPQGAPRWKRLAHTVTRGGVRLLLGRDLPLQAWYPYLNLLVLPPPVARRGPTTVRQRTRSR